MSINYLSMEKQADILKAVRQHLEIDSFFTGDFGVKGDGLADIEIEAEAGVVGSDSSAESGAVAGAGVESGAGIAGSAGAGGTQADFGGSVQAVSRDESQNASRAADSGVDAMSSAVRAVSSVEESGSAVSNDREADMVNVEQELKKLAAAIDKCRACELGESRMNTVPGEGSNKADIVFVGEAPGAEEDKSGQPFVGRAGKLLTKIIEAMGVTREDVYICNTLKCRPPGNRDPKPSEKAACRHFLHGQLRLINPKIIVALGSHAAKELLQTDKPIGQLRGKFHDYHVEGMSEPIKVMPTYHPSYLLRNYNVDSRRRVWQDMQVVMKELGLPVPKKKQSLK